MTDPTPASAGGAPLSRRDLEARIVAKAWRDPAFKQRLITNPHATMQAELSAIDPSITLPPSLNIHVHEETPTDYHLVLPRNPRDISLGEVLGDNLETVAPQTVAVLIGSTNNAVVNLIANVVTGPAANVAAINAVVTNTTSTVVGNVVGNVVLINNVAATTVGNVNVVSGLVNNVASNSNVVAASAALANSVANAIA